MKKIISFSLAFTFSLTVFALEGAPSQVSQEFESFKNLITESLDFRARSYQFAEKKQIEAQEHILLTREESNYLYEQALQYAALRKKIIKSALDVKKYFYIRNDVELDLVNPTFLEKRQQDQGEAGISSVGSTDDYLHINPHDELGKKRIREIQHGLVASLVLIDNYIVGIMPYHKNKELDYLLNYDTAQKKVLQEIVSSYSSINNRHAISKAIRFFNSYQDYVRQRGLQLSVEESFLFEAIESSTWYHLVQTNQATHGFKDTISNLWARLARKGRRSLRIISYGLSQGFGNVVGLISFRKGYLNEMPMDEKQKLISQLKPLDILLEKTPFRLTDRMIPGHYGHVAIWLGTEEQLKEANLWEQIPENFKQKIRDGHSIVEALRPGVQINTLDHFLNIDDLLVVRDKRDTTLEYKRQAILTALQQVGKAYDFNFDISTHKRIVCSELAYVVFPDIQWPTKRSAGRFTISPDNVANLSINDDRTFEPVVLYYKGKPYYRDLPYSLSLLLKAKVNYYMLFEQFQAETIDKQ